MGRGKRNPYFCGHHMCHFIPKMLTDTLFELHGRDEVQELLRAENRDGYTPLLLAIMRNAPESKEIIQVLLDRGVKVGDR